MAAKREEKRVSFNVEDIEEPKKKDVDLPLEDTKEWKSIVDKYTPKAIGANGRSAKSMYLLRTLATSLGFENLYEKPTQLLPTVDLDGIINYIKEEGCKNIVLMCGAGISTSAGIPDYRTPGTGMYDILQKNLDKYNLPNPEAIFTSDFFKSNPGPYYTFAKQRWPRIDVIKPTPCHYFIRLLAEKGLLLRVFTQNIDNLELVAGLPEDKLIQAHGTYHTAHCLDCEEKYTWDWLRENVKTDEVPPCTTDGCRGIIKPDIVMFGDCLKWRFFEAVQEDFPQCDLLIVMGTSLAVQPFNTLVPKVGETTPRLFINLEKVGTGDAFFAIMGIGAGFQFDSKDNYRDVFWQGACDDGCYTLADGLGWGEELRDLVRREHARIDAKRQTEDPKRQSEETKRQPKVTNPRRRLSEASVIKPPTTPGRRLSESRLCVQLSQEKKPPVTKQTIGTRPKTRGTGKPKTQSPTKKGTPIRR